MKALPVIHFVLGLLLAPFLFGVINRTKAFFAGRRGQPLLQMYYDLWKLVRKGAVYSETTTWVFRAGPVVSLAAVVLALLFVPAGRLPAVAAFGGDILLVAYLLALARFATMSAALDTGSSFEGMGASREAQFSAMAEPALLISLAALGRHVHAWSLSGIINPLGPEAWRGAGPVLALAAGAMAIVFLVENARIPVDDPNTHLELTMIHEVMVLDHGGPDFAAIQYGAALKLWLLGSLLVGIAAPVHTGSAVIDGAAFLGGMCALGVCVGAVESSMARLRLTRVPHLIAGAAALALLAAIMALR
ncbi:hydrogenase [bacterium]|nr:hydrogenase [bacterium]